MRPKMPRFTPLLLALCVGPAVGFLACNTKPPTEPDQIPGPHPPPPPSATWNIEVLPIPDFIRVGSSEFSTVTVEVRRQPDGSKPPDGATLVIRTSLGELDSAGSGVQERFAVLEDGRVVFRLFPGEIGGLAIVQGRLESSIGDAEVQIRDFNPRVLGVDPSSGPESGGTNVDVTGFDFEEPVQVFFGGSAAQVLEFFDSTHVRVRTPPSAESLPEVACTFCDLSGMRFVGRSVDVTLRNVLTGREGTLSQAFLYTPLDPTCRVDREPLRASFVVEQDPDNPFRFRFEDTSTGLPAPNAWTWTLGDGTTRTLREFTHTYSDPGVFEVRLTARNTCAGTSDTAVQFVTAGP